MSDPKKSLDYAQKALALSEKSKLLHLQAEAYNSMMIAEMAKEDYKNALEIGKKGLDFAKKKIIINLFMVISLPCISGKGGIRQGFAESHRSPENYRRKRR